MLLVEEILKDLTSHQDVLRYSLHVQLVSDDAGLYRPLHRPLLLTLVKNDLIFYHYRFSSLFSALTLFDRIDCLQRISQVKPGGFLRLRVDGGGCSGFKYKFELSESLDSDDHIFERYLCKFRRCVCKN